MASSGVDEFKLEFASYMAGRGGLLIDGMARRGGLAPISFEGALSAVRRLELYVPVAAHRAMWTGIDTILVALQLDEQERPVAFSPGGQRIVLNGDHPPVHPVLGLVSAEGDFSTQLPMNLQGKALANCFVAEAETLAQAGQRCALNLTRMKSRSTSANAAATKPLFSGAADTTLASDPTILGLYANFIRVLNTGEHWIRGKPEIELHATAKRSTSDGSARQFQCAGEHANNAGQYQPGNYSQSYVFDQNGHFWEGEVLVLNPTQIDTAQKATSGGFNVSIWEDDNESCRVRQPDFADMFRDAVLATAGIVRGAVAIWVRGEPDYEAAAGAFGSAAEHLFSLLRGGDDYVGVLVDIDSTTYAGQYPNNTHIIYDGTTFAGRATMNLKRTTSPAPTPGPVSSVSVLPSSDTVAVGYGRQFTAYAYDANGVMVSGRPITWQTANANVAAVSSDGFASGIAVGGTNVSATVDGVSGAAPITVIQTAPSAIESVSISTNPSVVQPNATCYWVASVAGGSGTLTYRWQVDNVVVGEDLPELWWTNSGSGFKIELQVTDERGEMAYTSKNVGVSSSAAACML